MEKFKAVEKEMKTKAYSKEGLSLASKIDPKDRERMEMVEFLQHMNEELEQQVEKIEADVEIMHATMKKGKKSDKLPEDERFDLNLTDIAEVWRRGSVISSWLLDLTAAALAKDQMLEQFSGKVADSGEGQWTLDAAMEEKVPVNVLAAALFARYRSRVDHTFGDQVLSAMRFGFGGHVEMPQ